MGDSEQHPEPGWNSEQMVQGSKSAEPVGARLQEFSSAWTGITQDSFVLGSLEKGHLIDLEKKPPLVLPSKKSELKVPRKYRAAMKLAVQDLLKEKNIELAPMNKGFFTYPFLIPKKNGDLRFIMNLKPLNKFVRCTRFKMLTLKQVKQTVRPGMWAVFFDLKSAYCHIPINRRHRCFLRFQFQGKVYQFRSLPFGLSTAPRTFVRVTRPILLYCRKRGILLFLYIDDGLVLAYSKERARLDGEFVIAFLQQMGFTISWDKSCLEPTQVFDYLGVQWNLKEMTLSLPENKFQKIRETATKVLERPTCRNLMKLLGQTNFAHHGLKFAKLNSRVLQFWLHKTYRSPKQLFQLLDITPEPRKALEWWANVKPNPQPLMVGPVQETVTTDASTLGYGGHLRDLSFSGLWPGQKGRKTHINALEFETVYKAAKRWQYHLQDKVTLFNVDNQTTRAYIEKEGGTHSRQLFNLTKLFLKHCNKFNITPIPAYLPGIANLKADALSREKKSDEWTLSHTAIKRLFKRWGTPTVDLFATKATKKVQCYFSPDRKDLQASGHDATLEQWPAGLRYAFPPPPLILQTLGQFRRQKHKGDLLLITPYWPDQPWFPEAVQMMVEPPRRFAPKETLLWNQTTGKPIPEVMKKVKLTSWKLTANPAKEQDLTELIRSLPQDDGAKVPKGASKPPGKTGHLSQAPTDYNKLSWV